MATNILYVITKANWGGAQRYVYDLAVEARNSGYGVTVAHGEGGELAERLEAADIRTVRLNGLIRDMGGVGEFRSFTELVRLLRRERPDIVHVNSAKAGGLGCLAARLVGTPRIIFTAHGWAFNETRPVWQKGIIRLVSWVTVLLSHVTICASEAVCRDIARMPFVSHRCKVIHHGITCETLIPREEARIRLAPKAEGSYWIGTLSELHPTKRVGDALRAFAQLRERYASATLVICGDGEERKKLEALAKELQVKAHVHFAGFVPGAPRLLSAFDMLVHPSVSEALGFTILEAGCASLPVVATRVGGIPEIITDEFSGLLVEPQRPHLLAKAMDALIREPAKASAFGTRLHARVCTDFSKQKMVEKTLAVYSR
jgi:glycosyltransferase involved in cell wall biosynthesis